MVTGLVASLGEASQTSYGSGYGYGDGYGGGGGDGDGDGYGNGYGNALPWLATEKDREGTDAK